MKKKLTILAAAVLLSGCGTAMTEMPAENMTEAAAETVTETVTETETQTEPAETETETETVTEPPAPEIETDGDLLSSPEDIGLTDIDGGNTNFEFTYAGEVFTAQYTPDNWKIIDSYRIVNTNDMKIICRALIEVNPIHGSDMQSYRTAEDLAYEWTQHNIAYELLPEDSEWKSHAKDVDLNPEDQDKGLYELFLSRTGEQGGDLYDQLVRGAEGSE